MPGPTVAHFESDLALPQRVDVVVIGGGIVGSSTALELAERGISVLLCEKGVIGGEQSSRNWGWVRMAMRDPREIPLMTKAFDMWEGMATRIGRDVGFTRSGILYTARSDQTLETRARWLALTETMGVRGQMVDAETLLDLMPGCTLTDLSGALHTPLDGRAEPQLAAPAIAEGARARGAAVMTNCAVRSLDVQAGRVAGVHTERGRVACDAVVLAGGAWSRLFAGNAGINLPQLKTLNTVMRTTPVHDGPESAIWEDRCALRKRADGGYTIANGTENTVDIVPDSFRLGLKFLPAYLEEWRSLGFRLSSRWREEYAMSRRWMPDDVTAFETCRVLDPQPSLRVLRKTWANAQAAFPQFAKAEVVQSWGGMIDVTPDAIPVISAVDDLPGLTIATGFSGHGFGIGPAAGLLTADLVTNTAPIVDPTDFRLSRFFDGSKMVLMPGL